MSTILETNQKKADYRTENTMVIVDSNPSNEIGITRTLSFLGPNVKVLNKKYLRERERTLVVG